MPVFLVHVTATDADRLRPISDEQWSTPASMPKDWSELVPELNAQASDNIIAKKQWGAFYGTELDLQLRRRKIDTIVLCGIATNVGVESTARFAYEYGYQQVFAEDAMSSMSARVARRGPEAQIMAISWQTRSQLGQFISSRNC